MGSDRAVWNPHPRRHCHLRRAGFVDDRDSAEGEALKPSAVSLAARVLCSARRGEPKSPCPFIDFDAVTGENFYNDSALCQNGYAFLLTPTRKDR